MKLSSKSMWNQLKEKRGFTLTEMIVTIAIIGVLTGITAVGINGYLSSAYTTRVNETAKTIFYAAQSHLSEKKQMGLLDAFNQEAESFGEDISWDNLKVILEKNRTDFDAAAYESLYDIDSARFILMEKGSQENNPLYQIVKDATQDSGLLDHTFLLEYDKLSGVVRSVFYSEKVNAFSYGLDDDSLTAKDNVILRDTDSLHKKRQGYYGVDITGKKPVSEIYVEEPVNVALFNQERLYLQWTDTNKGKGDFDLHPELWDSLKFDIAVYRKTVDTPVLVMTLSDVAPADKAVNITMDQADDSTQENKGYRLAYQYDAITKASTYQLLLDDIHHSLFQYYTSKNTSLPANIQLFEEIRAEDQIYCEVVAKLDKGETGYDATSLPRLSNLQSSAYGGGEKEVEFEDLTTGTSSMVATGATGILEEGTSASQFSLLYARHLENVRYSENIKEFAYFNQSASIDWAKVEGRSGKQIPFQTITYYDEAGVTKPFQGSFSVKKNAGSGYLLSNIVIQEKEKVSVGIFSQNMGSITGLNLKDPKVQGGMLAGIVAGVNGKEIRDITIRGGSLEGSHLLGGITGYNTEAGTLDQVDIEASVNGSILLSEGKSVTDIDIFAKDTKGRYIGGVAGLNKGGAGKLTTGKKTVTGTSYVGGIFGSNSVNENRTIETLKNYNGILLCSNASASEPLEYFGGLTGYQGKGKIKDSYNYGLVRLEKPDVSFDPDKVVHIGGIAGYNEGTIDTCVNSAGKDQLTTLQNDCIAKIKNNTLPSYMGKNVGGIAGTNASTAVIRKSRNESGAVLGNSVIGGFVGSNRGSEIDIAGNEEVSGLVIGSGYLVGGIFGYNDGGSVNKYVNSANVFGKGMVGGIMGFHGKLEGEEQKVLTYLKNLETLSGDLYYKNLLEVEDTLLANSGNGITECDNKGYVYAQKFFFGGIAGVNYGSITKSNQISTVNFPEITSLGKADCVGGIAGFNSSSAVIDGKRAVKQSVSIHLTANHFVGGVVGLNRGKVQGYMEVTGSVNAKGDCVGGVFGLNTNPAAVSELTDSNLDSISGRYFVGGIMGCNVSLSGAVDTHIKGVNTKKGNISADAYAGGILGCNTSVSQGTKLGSLYGTGGELSQLILNAYIGDIPTNPSSLQKTIFQSCSSSATVRANRYLGGIAGYNSYSTDLWMLACSNNGIVEVRSTSRVDKSPDGATYYYVGGITGRNSSAGVIHNCKNNGVVKSPSTYLGGICEVNEGYVQFCSSGKNENVGEAFGTVGDNSVGGIVGLNRKDAKVVSCYADSYAKIKGGNRTGGLVGTNLLGGIVTSNYAGNEAKDVSLVDPGSNLTGDAAMSYCSGEVIGKNDTGGIVGYNEGTVSFMIVKKTASINGEENVGGFVGNNASGASMGSGDEKIANLTNEAKVYGSHEVGGIVGKHNVKVIENCNNKGIVQAIGDGYGYAGGITGSNGRNVEIKNCNNYGTVRSEFSFAGGITGINDATITNSNNYGSVEGSFHQRPVAINASTATGSAIGGITGANLLAGKIYDCASRDNSAIAGAESRNQIKGNYIVGGIIGYYARHSNSKSEFLNRTDESREVDIRIVTNDSPVETSGSDPRCRIGGFIGRMDPTPMDTTFADYTFSGTIEVTEKAAKNEQEIGGIIGWQHSNITLENCMFEGKILGEGNNLNDWDQAGVGGLAGRSDGKIVVYPYYPEGNSVFAANSRGSVVEGAKRVGGIVGEMSGSCMIYLKTDDGNVLIEDANKNKGESEYYYFTNFATVSGGKNVGGFYGSASPSSGKLLYLKNEGVIKAKNVNGNINLGGIAGSTNATLISYCVNEVDIGTDDNKNFTSQVGGIIGSRSDDKWATVSNCMNKGQIYAGKSSIGGLFGNLKNAEIMYTCKNEGDILVNVSKSSSEVTRVGGIIGNAENIQILNDSVEQQILTKRKDIILKGMGSQIGGLIGAAAGKITIENITNVMAIVESSNAANKNRAVKSGGFIGYVQTTDTLSLKHCLNDRQMQLGEGKEVGGLIGKAHKGTLLLEDCENLQPVTAYERVAGIIAYIENSTQIIMEDNVNSGMITARSSAGGLIGEIIGTVGEIKDSENKASIVNKEPGQTSTVWNVGGCIGKAETEEKEIDKVKSSLVLFRLTNSAPVTINADKNITQANDIGGIAGYLSQNGVVLNNCINKGAVKVTPSSNGGQKTYAVGGIAGSLRGEAKIGANDSKNQRTRNQGVVNTSGGVSNNAYEIGGIVGFSAVECLIKYAENEADVLGGLSSSESVGGIVGKTYGWVMSTRTKEGIRVEGRQNVGGLVGRALEYTCRVTSAGTGIKEETGYDLSVSNALVTGQEKVGGIVGYLQEATIYNVYVSDKAEVVLDRQGNLNPVKSVGGIIGYAGPASLEISAQGIVASCYSFAAVKDKSTNNADYYVGGVMGYRYHDPQTKKAAASITDSFQVSAAKVSATIPPNDGLAGTVKRESWAVGNEPYVSNGSTGAIYQDNADVHSYEGAEQDNPLLTAGKYIWDEKACLALRKILNINSVLQFDSEEAILEIMQKYDGFKLPPPEIKDIASNKGFEYDFIFKKLPGFYTKYGFNFYLGDYETGKVIPADAAANRIGKSVETGDGKTIITSFPDSITKDLSKDVFDAASIKNYIGQTITVTTYAEGYSLDELHYAKKSDEVVMQKFVIMPPLPDPICKPIDPKVTDTDWFDAEGRQVKAKLEITNWLEYIKAADAVYANLLGKTPLYEPDLYTEFRKGLYQFKMLDTFTTAKDQPVSNDSKISIYHDISEYDPDNEKYIYYEVIGDQAFITIDYTNNTIYKNNAEARPWHAYTLQARIKDDMRGLSLDPADADFKYRYVDSLDRRSDDFRLKTKLKPPLNLKSEYTGSRTAEDTQKPPGYQLKWDKNNTLNQYIKGYRVELLSLKQTDPDGSNEVMYDFNQTDPKYEAAPYKTEVTGSDNTFLQLTKEQLDQIFTDAGIDLTVPWYSQDKKYSLAFQVIVLSNDSEACIDSKESSEFSFPLIHQQNLVENITASDDKGTMKLKIQWNDPMFDPAAPGISQEEKDKNVYEVSYEIISNQVSIQAENKVITGAASWEDIILQPALKDASYTLTVKVMKRGLEGSDPAKVSLNSDIAEKEIVIGKRLRQPEALEITADRIEEDGEKNITLYLTWKQPTGTPAAGEVEITEENCSGYQIDTVINDAEDKPIVTNVDKFDIYETVITLPLQDLKNLKFNIRATGNEKAENSDWLSQSFAVSESAYKKPEITEIKTSGGFSIYPDQEDPFALERSDYPQGEGYQFEIDVVEGDSSVAGQYVEIYHGDLLLNSYRTDITSGTGTINVSLDTLDDSSIALAGEEITVRLSNRSSSLERMLPSEVNEIKFTMPKIHLDKPEVTELNKKQITETVMDITDILNPVPVNISYSVFSVSIDVFGNTLSDGQKEEETEARLGQIITICDKNGDEVPFVLMNQKEDGTFEPSGSAISQLSVKEDEKISFFFKLENETAATDFTEFTIKVRSIADPDQERYADSNTEEKLLDDAIIVTAITLDFPILVPEELPLLPEEQTTTEQTSTEQDTTEQDTTEQDTTEQDTTEQSSTEQSSTEQSTTEQSTTEQGSTEQSTAGQGSTEQSTAEHGTEQSAAEHGTELSSTEQGSTEQSTADHVSSEQSTANLSTGEPDSAKLD